MKKLYFIFLFVFVALLPACTSEKKQESNTVIDKHNISTNQKNIKEDKISENQEIVGNENEVQDNNLENTVQETDNQKNGEQNNEIQDNFVQEDKKQLEKKRKEEEKKLKNLYVNKLKELTVLGWNEIEQLTFLSNANCTWVCNLDEKQNLLPVELKVAKSCYNVCVKKQEEAKNKLKEIENKIEQAKKQYPKKCFEDAEKMYNKILQVDKDVNDKIRNDKEKFIKNTSERCLLVYAFTNSDCEKIKKWSKPYEKCIRLQNLQIDLEFINQWQYKSFDDYILEIPPLGGKKMNRK